MKVIVIGSLASGIAAAQMLAGTQGAQITVYERGGFFSCGQYGLPHYLANPQADLADALRCKADQMQAQGIQGMLRHDVVHIDALRKQITVRALDTGNTFTEAYDRLVVATGSGYAVPQVPGAEKMGVHTLETVGDVLFLREFLKTPYVQDIVILGGGLMALEVAKAMLRRGRKVRMILREQQLWPCLDGTVAALVQQRLEAQGVQFLLGERVRSFQGRTYVESVRTDRGEYPCDLCIAAEDAAPRTALLAGSGVALDRDGAVLITADYATNIADLYAAGSCARTQREAQGTQSLHIGGLEVALTGMSEAQARLAHRSVASVTFTGHDRPGICPNPCEVTLKLLYDQGTHQLLGAQGWGEKNVACRINALAVAVTAGLRCEQLAGVDFMFSAADGALWDPIQLACRQIR